jgi:hypothetical protein
MPFYLPGYRLLLFPAVVIILAACAIPVPAQTATPAPAPLNAADDRAISLRQFPSNLIHDQKEIWLFPSKIAKGKYIWPVIGIVGVTTALIATDPRTAPPFRTTDRFSGFNRVFSSTNTGAFIAAVPVTMYGIGWLRKDSYAKNTALLAAEALADGFILDLPFKAITARQQPLAYAGNGPYNDSFFNGTHNPFHSGGFYSGHAMAATSVAAVIAHRYRSHRWVPYVAYGLVGAISFSRITRSDHFPVFFGGAMGFVIARYVVLPPGE